MDFKEWMLGSLEISRKIYEMLGFEEKYTAGALKDKIWYLC